MHKPWIGLIRENAAVSNQWAHKQTGGGYKAPTTSYRDSYRHTTYGSSE